MAKIRNAKQWVEQGAPAQALEFLGSAVDQLSKVAMEKQIVFKEKQMNDDVVTQTADETVANADVVIETVETSDVNEKGKPLTLDVLQKSMTDAIVAALKQYNDSVVVPLQSQIAELQTKAAQAPTIVKSHDQNVFFGASDFMPAAAVADMIKKEFGVSESVQKGDIVAPDNSATVVTKKEIAKSYDSSNLLAGF